MTPDIVAPIMFGGFASVAILFALAGPAKWLYDATRMPWEPVVLPFTRWALSGVGPVEVVEVGRYADFADLPVTWRRWDGKSAHTPMRDFIQTAKPLTDEGWYVAVEKAKIAAGAEVA